MSSIRDRRQLLTTAAEIVPADQLSLPAQRIITAAGFSITVKAVSGTLEGSFALQATDFGDTPEQIQEGDWLLIPDSIIAVTGFDNTADPIGWNVADPNHSWIRVIFTDTASTVGATFKAAMTVRART